MPIRRRANPSIVQLVWNCIKNQTEQQELVDFSKITHYLESELRCTQEAAENHVLDLVLDGLILENTRVHHADGKSTSIQGYKIPYGQTVSNENKDWYCIECHLAGFVEECLKCHRVFHPDCLIKKPPVVVALKFLNDTSTPPILKDISLTDPVSVFKENGSISDPVPLELIKNDVDNNRNDEKTSSYLNLDNNVNGNLETLCSICKIKKEEDLCPLDKKDLNYLFGFILDRIKSWLPVNLTHKMDPEQQQELCPSQQLEWRSKQLWFAPISMADLQKKVNNREYSSISEFQADVLMIRHNIAIFHGLESQEYGAAELMLRDCCHELSELCVCSDCYRHSNEKLHTSWFCFPCKNPHRLVWAKQKGYPHWPAKIIRETDTLYDVRFFGGKYERSILSKNSVKPIDTPMDKLQIKHNAGFKKALDELHLHQSLLADESAIEKLLVEGKWAKEKKKRRSNGSPKTERKSLAPKKPLIQIKSDIYEFPDGSDGVIEPPPQFKRKSNANKIIKKSKKPDINEVVCVRDEDDHLTSSSFPSTETRVDQVTSSTECIPSDDHSERQMHELDKPYSDMRRKLEAAKDKNDLILTAMNSTREEIDRIEAEHAEQIRKLTLEHEAQISETKRKQWCYNCQQDAIYHCCWNTAYCSPACQQHHWQAEHKKVCRRKR
ncbi:zinc finger MYND domain-containing protein 11 isoform X2 [Onthophagus taurus]|uniref:zinc finger MYND domain-containing protein 11 isoform X2 n=1 Tax=Onthophagus taurus TaxID=166361 RepID=UPI000C205317|nr:zinc finger MYND domain-containing protein 11 isoform X2 [Onthophagus taurus]